MLFYFNYIRVRGILSGFLLLLLLNITDATKVCSTHFKMDDLQKTPAGLRKLTQGVIPTVFSWTSQKKDRPPPKEKTNKP